MYKNSRNLKYQIKKYFVSKMFLPFTVRINFFRVLKNVANFEPSAFISFFSIPRAIFSHSPPINLHPWKWFEGYPVKSALFFPGWQKHLRSSRVATREKKMGHCCSKREEARLLLLFLNNNDLEKKWVLCLGKSQVLLPP